MPPQRPPRQRRSACNRCRTYKLRCERDPSQPNGLCERCRKTGAECTTATTISDSNIAALVGTDPGPGSGQNHIGVGTSTGSISSSWCELTPQPVQTRREVQSAGGPVAARADESSADGTLGGVSQTLGRFQPLDLNLPRFIPPNDVSNALPGPERSHDVDWRQAFTECLPGDITIFDATYIDSAPPEPLPLVRGIASTTGPSNPSPSQSIDAWCADLATPLPLEVAGSDNSNMDLISLRSQNDGDSQATIAHNYLSDVLELGRRLAEDYESLRTADVYPPYAGKPPNPIETAVQCATNRSSHFCELLKNIINEDRSITSTLSSLPYNPILGRRGKPGIANCVVLTTSLITTYILLVRNWRRIFIHLHRLLLVGQVSSDFSIMPSLHLWDSRVQSSPTTQVAVLIELSFDILGQIETRLGAGCWGISGARKGSIDHNNKSGDTPLQVGCVLQGPVAISIRDMLLSQEMVQLAEGADELDTLPLGELAAQLKSRLKDRG